MLMQLSFLFAETYTFQIVSRTTMERDTNPADKRRVVNEEKGCSAFLIMIFPPFIIIFMQLIWRNRLIIKIYQFLQCLKSLSPMTQRSSHPHQLQTASNHSAETEQLNTSIHCLSSNHISIVIQPFQ